MTQNRHQQTVSRLKDQEVSAARTAQRPAEIVVGRQIAFAGCLIVSQKPIQAAATHPFKKTRHLIFQHDIGARRTLAALFGQPNAAPTPHQPIAACGHAALGAVRLLQEPASTRRLPAVSRGRSALPLSNAAPNRLAR